MMSYVPLFFLSMSCAALLLTVVVGFWQYSRYVYGKLWEYRAERKRFAPPSLPKKRILCSEFMERAKKGDFARIYIDDSPMFGSRLYAPDGENTLLFAEKWDFLSVSKYDFPNTDTEVTELGVSPWSDVWFWAVMCMFLTAMIFVVLVKLTSGE